MFIQTIKIKLQPDKYIEFSQCWHRFVEHFQKTDGTIFEMRQKGKDNYKLILRFENHKQLDNMMKNEFYKYLMGAIKTLGEDNEKTTI